jgi:hypothetical protein
MGLFLATCRASETAAQQAMRGRRRGIAGQGKSGRIHFRYSRIQPVRGDTVIDDPQVAMHSAQEMKRLLII